MQNWWSVEQLDVERLLGTWRWLCPQKLALVARNAYGDLFLQDDTGSIFWLDVGSGAFSKIADSKGQFVDLAAQPGNRDDWFAESDERTAAVRGLISGPSECIGFDIPVVFAESGSSAKPYVTDIYDYVGMLGDLHKQIADLPDGAKVKLTVKR